MTPTATQRLDAALRALADARRGGQREAADAMTQAIFERLYGLDAESRVRKLKASVLGESEQPRIAGLDEVLR